MTDHLIVDLQNLREILLAALDHVEQTNGQTVELRHDYFWAIGSDEKYDVDRKPTILTVGQLSENLTFLNRAVEGDAVVSRSLAQVAELLTAIGYQANP